MKSSIPLAPGRYAFRAKGDTRAFPCKVIDMNGELYALRPRFFLFVKAVPIRDLAGHWSTLPQ